MLTLDSSFIQVKDAHRNTIQCDGEVLEDVLTTHVQDLTKFTGFRGANKTGLFSSIATAIGVEIVSPRLAGCIAVYIHNQRMIWAAQEYSNNSAKFDERCPELYKIFSNKINKRKRMTDACAAFATGNETEKQILLLGSEHAGTKRKIDARAAFTAGNETQEHKLLLGWEHARNERMIDARAAFATGNETEKQILLLDSEHAGTKRKIDARAAFTARNETEEQILLLAPEHARSELLMVARATYNAGNATEEEMDLLAPEHARSELLMVARVAYNAGNMTEVQMTLLAPEPSCTNTKNRCLAIECGRNYLLVQEHCRNTRREGRQRGSIQLLLDIKRIHPEGE